MVVEDIDNYDGRDNRELRRGAMPLALPWILLCTVEYSRIGHNKKGEKGGVDKPMPQGCGSIVVCGRGAVVPGLLWATVL